MYWSTGQRKWPCRPKLAPGTEFESFGLNNLKYFQMQFRVFFLPVSSCPRVFLIIWNVFLFPLRSVDMIGEKESLFYSVLAGFIVETDVLNSLPVQLGGELTWRVLLFLKKQMFPSETVEAHSFSADDATSFICIKFSFIVFTNMITSVTCIHSEGFTSWSKPQEHNRKSHHIALIS